MNNFVFWLASLAGLAVAFVALPGLRLIIGLLMIPYVAVALWGIFDLRSNYFVRAFIRSNGEIKRISLTFDDGPDQVITGAILDLLKQFGLRATFFVVGEKARAFPDLVKRAYKEGHVIACHDLSHGASSNLRFSAAMVRDIGESQKIVRDIIGRKMLLYRPPVGLANPHLGTALDVCGMKCIGWNKSCRDAGNRRINNIKKISKLDITGGDVILLHDCLPVAEYKNVLLQQVELLFERIKQENFEPVGVDELFELDAYSRD
ncbi:MAG TPA: polysaccharide deacetylase family protein [Chitinivibrionales bacterium]|nr:polysaccharide deacetylase family protein [Chitinivibrionales bacterium]